MREIKFRQPQKSGGFHYWGYVDGGPDVFVGPLGLNNAAGPSEQYTGLKDKNGKEIYEGDIVYREGKGEYTVRWEQKCCGFIMDGEGDSWKWPKEDYSPIYEIVGNIYENPEILK